VHTKFDVYVFIQVAKAQKVKCDKGTRKAIFMSVTVYNKKISSQIEQVQGKMSYLSYMLFVCSV
jgi:hypothetical protein